MKKIFIISILLGIIFSLIMFLNYRKNTNNNKIKDTIYFFQESAYKNVDNISNVTKNLESYIVIKESDNLYHIYIALTKDKKNLEKLKEIYKKSNDNIYVRQKVVSCENFIFELNNYDLLLSNTESREVIDKIQKEVLKKYKECNCENIRNG